MLIYCEFARPPCQCLVFSTRMVTVSASLAKRRSSINQTHVLKYWVTGARYWSVLMLRWSLIVALL